MAWIESHQGLLRHPKTLQLANMMGWGLDETIGKLHRFWWWCLDYAEDGDLQQYNDTTLAAAVGVAPQDAKRFVEAMVGCGGETVSGFIDRQPYFRVRKWWNYCGKLLQIRYKHNPKKWKKIQSFYVGRRKNGSKGGSNNRIPNQTKPDQTKTLTPPLPPPFGGEPPSPTENGEYKIRTPVQFVVGAYKVARGIPLENREWDRDNFKRCSAPAKEILAIFNGDQDKAAESVMAIARWANKKRLSWTLETCLKRASDYKMGVLDK